MVVGIRKYGVSFVNIKKFFSYYLILSSLILFPIFDLLNKYSKFFGSGISFSIFIRGIFEILFLVYILFSINNKKLNYFLLLLTLISLWSINAVFYYQTTEIFFRNFVVFNKYIYSIIIALVAMDIQDKKWNFLFNLFEYIVFINALITLVGLFFNLSLFKTYPYDYRWGYSGFVPAQNEATFFWISGIIYYYYKISILKRSDLKAWLVFFASIFVGVKGIYIFLFFLLFYSFIMCRLINKIKILLGVFFLIWVVMYFLKEKIYLLGSFFVYNYNKMDFLTFLLSSRNIKLETTFINNIQKNWSFLNFIFGGLDIYKYYTEMAFIDLFSFMGFLGMIIYLVLWKKIVFDVSVRSKTNLFLLVILLIIAGFGGHFFNSAINAIYYVLLGKWIKKMIGNIIRNEAYCLINIKYVSF